MSPNGELVLRGTDGCVPAERIRVRRPARMLCIDRLLPPARERAGPRVYISEPRRHVPPVRRRSGYGVHVRLCCFSHRWSRSDSDSVFESYTVWPASCADGLLNALALRLEASASNVVNCSFTVEDCTSQAEVS